jgi:hypothetical protein
MRLPTAPFVRLFSTFCLALFIAAHSANAAPASDGGVNDKDALNPRTGTEAQDPLARVTLEPASLLLFGSGLCYLAARIRRQSRQKATADSRT